MTRLAERTEKAKAKPVVGQLAYANLVNVDCDWGYGCSGGTTALGSVSIGRSRASTATRVYIVCELTEPRVAAPWSRPLNEIRDNLAATVAQVADSLGVTRQTYYAWQRGEKSPSAENQKRIGQLRGAAATLKREFGPRLGLYLNYPVGPNEESFWELMANSQPVKEATALLVSVARTSIERRRAAELAFGDEGDG